MELKYGFPFRSFEAIPRVKGQYDLAFKEMYTNLVLVAKYLTFSGIFIYIYILN